MLFAESSRNRNATRWRVRCRCRRGKVEEKRGEQNRTEDGEIGENTFGCACQVAGTAPGATGKSADCVWPGHTTMLRSFGRARWRGFAAFLLAAGERYVNGSSSPSAVASRRRRGRVEEPAERNMPLPSARRPRWQRALLATVEEDMVHRQRIPVGLNLGGENRWAVRCSKRRATSWGNRSSPWGAGEIAVAAASTAMAVA